MRKAKKHIFTLALTLAAVASTQLAVGIPGIPRMGMHLSTSFSEPVDYTSQYAKEAAAAKDSFKTSTAFPYASQKKALKDYAAVNGDIKAWLYVPGTNINQPIAHHAKNNSYYLYRDWKGNSYSINYKNWYQNPSTVTYLDYRTKIGDSWATSSRNLVLYGHNWSNLSEPAVIGDKAGHVMFAQLPSYTNLEFAKEHPHIYFSTGEYEGIWRVFAAGYCSTSPSFFYNNPNPTKKQLQALIEGWQARSKFTFGVEVNNEDRILTLSTCTRQQGPSDQQRYVVVARLLRPGESEKDKVEVAVNKNMIPFSFSPPAAEPSAAVTSTENPSTAVSVD